MEGVGVVLPVSDAGHSAITLLVHADEAAGQAFCGSSQQGEVHLQLLRLIIAELAHKAQDLLALFLPLLILAVVVTIQGCQGFCQTDEADA